MRKSQHGTPKRQGGISLVPALWDEIEQAARRADVSKNQVMETILMREFCVAVDSRKTVVNSPSVQASKPSLRQVDDE